MGSRALKFLAAFMFIYAAYLSYSSASPDTFYENALFGAFVSLVGAFFLADVLITKHPSKAFNPRRWAWLLAYAAHYFTLMELKAHLDVVKRILHPKMPIRPGIVRVPYYAKSDHGVVAVANSVTNTPGTVVVDLDTAAQKYYIHWIDVLSTDEKACFEAITKDFEKYARRVFD
ncbi:MAG: Na+/H+ antiporter subunit E [Candidatus Nezhaarchaeota archaeon]|nr:Na+/H+ antiporter subunit E [Candidatus Nezhaarchaeota archaeon]